MRFNDDGTLAALLALRFRRDPAESGRPQPIMHERLGDAVLAAEAAYAGTGAFPELLRIYHLIDDPALKLR